MLHQRNHTNTHHLRREEEKTTQRRLHGHLICLCIKFLVLIYLHITFIILIFYYISLIWMNNIYIILVCLFVKCYNYVFLYEYFLYAIYYVFFLYEYFLYAIYYVFFIWIFPLCYILRVFHINISFMLYITCFYMNISCMLYTMCFSYEYFLYAIYCVFFIWIFPLCYILRVFYMNISFMLIYVVHLTYLAYYCFLMKYDNKHEFYLYWIHCKPNYRFSSTHYSRFSHNFVSTCIPKKSKVGETWTHRNLQLLNNAIINKTEVHSLSNR